MGKCVQLLKLQDGGRSAGLKYFPLSFLDEIIPDWEKDIELSDNELICCVEPLLLLPFCFIHILFLLQILYLEIQYRAHLLIQQNC